ncbi:hypothetical protein FQP90_12160 [Paenarthrobacter nitroguajacolicus]|uniref:Phosphotyrosine protein phosphatase I domain-containing protein n=1 Tax=Paenarthrobacter nitroguajacolicus TaxID=211146 RepID=A0A558GZU3_PAENT|nr:hypothetical protein [Paenarthrobacter nitroguajacolicus]TVU62388.1 hypothetical protein FQP90_12160 [Paenarthrobacter nitroguajacolicus]
MTPVSLGAQPPSLILTVCTGNICRSPLAEQLIRARLSKAGIGNFSVGSAGLNAAVNAPMEPLPAALSTEYGGNSAGSFGKQITEVLVGEAELVLTMTRKQRDELVKKYPGAAQQTFTMAEFVRAAESLPLGQSLPPAPSWAAVTGKGTDSGVAGLVRRIAAVRSTAELADADDIPDPINATEAVHREVAHRIATYSDDVVSILGKHL